MFLFAVALPSLAAEPDIYRGTLGRCRIFIARPARYAHKMLLLAHGLRTESMPLTAEVNLQEPLYKNLLEQGFLIASTSYRRNGPVIDEAAQDLLQLRDFAVKNYGRPDRLYLLGTSMGGAIAVRLAEDGAGGFDGMLCVGAALSLCPQLRGTPAAPIVFLSNRNEAEGPAAYIKKVRPQAVRPALWTVARDGHCNVNDRERLAAFNGLIGYGEKKGIAFSRDITIDLPAAASSADFDEGGACAAVSSVDPVYGNLYTRFVQADLEKLGIRKGEAFTVRFGGREHPVVLGTTYGDAAQGGLVALVLHDATVQVARNLSSAAVLLGCRAGDRLCVVKGAPVRPESPDRRR